MIPEDAVPPNTTIHFNVAIAAPFDGQFLFPNNRVPISPILWLCVQKGGTFIKPIQIHLPHYLNLTSDGHINHDILVGKATHKCNEGSKFVFKQLDVSLQLDSLTHGVFSTSHCCFLCLNAGKEIVKKSSVCFLLCQCG